MGFFFKEKNMGSIGDSLREECYGLKKRKYLSK
jgi:hypothetical protein